MKTQNQECDFVLEALASYLEKTLPRAEAKQVEAHLLRCRSCAHEFREHERVLGLLAHAYSDKTVSPAFDERADRKLAAMKAGERRNEEVLLDGYVAEAAGPSWVERLGGAPWWGVSLVLHALVIALAGLISMAVSLPPPEDAVVMVTELSPRPKVTVEEEKKREPAKSALASKQETPPTDPTSKELNNIIVPPEILAKAELGDHFETINPDRPDTQSAFGNPDAQMFHSVQGNDEPEGGGGVGGSTLEDMIGVGGAGSPGSGGGWGGGNGTGIGAGNGSGRGSFGARNGGGRKLMVKRHGGNAATENAVDKALEWLARNQEADGSWDYKKHGGTHGAGKTIGDVAMTGYALLAFLGAGHTEKIGKYKDNVKRGAEWLIKGLGDKDRWSVMHESNYSHGIAAMALAEAAGMSPRNAEFKKAAQQAIDGVIAGQIKTGPSEYQAWDYAPSGVTNDTSITGWNIMALKSAKVAGLHVDMAAFEGAMNWIHVAQDLKNAPKEGEAEYWEGGYCSYRGTLANPGSPAGVPPQARFAIAAVTRLFVGGEKPSMPGVAGPCNLMKKNLPTQWPGNLYYWYYGTLAMFQKGGDHWKEWNEPLKKTLTENQRKDGDFEGSWDPGDNGLGLRYGGRVMSTALGALCLEIYYRFPKQN